MTALTDRLNAIRERAEMVDRAVAVDLMADVLPLLEAVEEVHGALAYSLEQTTNDEWDEGWDAACRKAIRMLEAKLGGDDE